MSLRQVHLQHGNDCDSGHENGNDVSGGLTSAASEGRQGCVAGLDRVHRASGGGDRAGPRLGAIGGVSADDLRGCLAVRAVGDGRGTRGNRIHSGRVHCGDGSGRSRVTDWVRGLARSLVRGSWVS